MERMLLLWYVNWLLCAFRSWSSKPDGCPGLRNCTLTVIFCSLSTPINNSDHHLCPQHTNTLFQYTAATKSSALDPTAKAVETLSNVFKKDAKLNTILHAPTLSAEDKQQIIVELQKHAGASGDVLKNFLATLAENNRLGLLEGVCEKFVQLMSAHKGEVELVVTSAAVGFCSNEFCVMAC